MKSQEDIKKIIKGLPDAPGVYRFWSGKGIAAKILYIGKATSLRDRVRSYFSPDIVITRSPLISKMLSEFDRVTFEQTDSVLEALVLEAHLIKKYQPEANIKEKDNKSFNFVVITREAFPRVLIIRGRELLLTRSVSKREDITYTFGPFPNGSQLREAMKIVRKLFPYRDKCVPLSELQFRQTGKGMLKNRQTPTSALGRPRPCFNHQIGLCPGVCVGVISEKEYAETIKNIILFFESNKKKLIKNLEKQMKAFAKAREFEKAEKIKKTIFTLNHIQDISLIKVASSATRRGGGGDPYESDLDTALRIESYDIAHLSGTNMVGVMTVVEDGETKSSAYRKFKIRGNTGANDTKALSEVLTRRLAHIEWPLPSLIVVDGGVAQKNTIEKILHTHRLSIPVVSVVKDEHHKAREILGEKSLLVHEREILLSNLEAHRYAIAYHKKLRGKIS